MKISLENVSMNFGNTKALKDVSVEFGIGINGLLGPNGAGKTTLMRMISTILEPSSGSIDVCGIEVSSKKEVRSLIGYLPQDFSCYPNLSVYEALDYLAVLSGLSEFKIRKEKVKNMLKQVNLEEEAKKKVGKLSGGMLKRLGIAQALIHDPKVLIVDEPTAGLSPEERIRFRNLLEDLSENKIVILSTHIVSDIESISDEIFILNKGEFRYNGDLPTLIAKASGSVWEGEVSRSELRNIEEQFTVISQAKNGKVVNVRVLSESKPFDGFNSIKPSLEDAYMFML